MFTKSARFYDLIYSFKNYEQEVGYLNRIIRQQRFNEPLTLLDVACGTGKHLEHFQKSWQCTGLDLDQNMLEIARGRLPDLRFYRADMSHFELSCSYDLITCLFSSIGYVASIKKLEQTLACFKKHLNPGGLMLVEPWFTPEQWTPGRITVQIAEEPDLKIARMNTSLHRGRLSYFVFHYLIGSPLKTEHFTERHTLGLFTQSEMKSAFEKNGLSVEYDPQGPSGRGLYISRFAR
ncbi:methyltransferase domain-containing protein [bacterium]|nr:methyltransferase domain-containing protein [bacterium]